MFNSKVTIDILIEYCMGRDYNAVEGASVTSAKLLKWLSSLTNFYDVMSSLLKPQPAEVVTLLPEDMAVHIEGALSDLKGILCMV